MLNNASPKAKYFNILVPLTTDLNKIGMKLEPIYDDDIIIMYFEGKSIGFEDNRFFIDFGDNYNEQYKLTGKIYSEYDLYYKTEANLLVVVK